MHICKREKEEDYDDAIDLIKQEIQHIRLLRQLRGELFSQRLCHSLLQNGLINTDPLVSKFSLDSEWRATPRKFPLQLDAFDTESVNVRSESHGFMFQTQDPMMSRILAYSGTRLHEPVIILVDNFRSPSTSLNKIFKIEIPMIHHKKSVKKQMKAKEPTRNKLPKNVMCARGNKKKYKKCFH
jgi:hypothetical protein